MQIDLVRIAYLPDVTLGRLRVGGVELVTLEEPWIKNESGPGGQRRNPATNAGESCVPDGRYTLTPHTGTRFSGVWRLSNHELGVYDEADELPAREAWGRSTVLIHSGNTTDDILGCILVGTHFSRLENKPAVINSVRALNILRELLGSSSSHSLSIRPTAGTS